MVPFVFAFLSSSPRPPPLVSFVSLPSSPGSHGPPESGTAVVCPKPGTPYTLEGCKPLVVDKDEEPCVKPSDMTGYRILRVHNVFKEGFHVDVSCAHGESEKAEAVQCDKAGGPYKLQGCEVVQKVRDRGNVLGNVLGGVLTEAVW